MKKSINKGALLGVSIFFFGSAYVSAISPCFSDPSGDAYTWCTKNTDTKNCYIQTIRQKRGREFKIFPLGNTCVSVLVTGCREKVQSSVLLVSVDDKVVCGSIG